MWMNFKNIMLIKGSQIEESAYCVLPSIQISKWVKKELMYYLGMHT